MAICLIIRKKKKKTTNNQKNRQRNRISLEEENGFSLGHVDAQVFMGSIEVRSRVEAGDVYLGAVNLKIVSQAMGVDKLTQQSERGNEKKLPNVEPGQ